MFAYREKKHIFIILYSIHGLSEVVLFFIKCFITSVPSLTFLAFFFFWAKKKISSY